MLDFWNEAPSNKCLVARIAKICFAEKMYSAFFLAYLSLFRVFSSFFLLENESVSVSKLV